MVVERIVMADLPLVSVVITTRRGGKLLDKCLASVLNQDYPKDKFEVIVVSDIPKVLTERQGPPPVKVHIAHVKPGAKRNLAARKARAEIIAFCDDDVTVDRSWLKRLVSHFTDAKVGITGGVNLTSPNAGFREKLSGYLYSSFLGSSAMSSRYLPDGRSPRVAGETDLISCNMGVRKEVFNKVGGFPEDLWPNEENAFCHLVGKAGYKLIYDPRAVVWHRRRAIFRPHLKQVMRSGWGRAQMMKTHPDSIRVIFLFPSIFVAGLLIGLPLSFINPIVRTIYIVAILSYLAVVTLISTRIAYRERSFKTFLLLPLAYFLHHCAYGIGMFIGLFSRKGRE